jgi:chromosome segregation ATPase
MSRQTKSISENEKQLAELERAYRALESRIGQEIVNSRDAPEPLPKETAEDIETLLKIKEKKDGYERAVKELREREVHQKECTLEFAKLGRIQTSKTAHRIAASEALGRALTEQYADSFSDFFGDAYEEIRAAEAKVEQIEEELREKTVSQGGIFASLKTTLGRSAKKASLGFTRQRLVKMYVSAGSGAFESAELKALSDSNALPDSVRSTYQNMLECEDELRALGERRDELAAQIKEDEASVAALGISPGRGSAAAKAHELEKEIGRAAVDERVVLSRIGKRFIESTKQHDRRKKNDTEESDAARSSNELAQLLERARLLRNEMTACKNNIEEANREIEAADTAGAIESLKNRITNIQKRIDKLSAEKTDAENEMKLLSEKLKSLGRNE